MFRHIWTMFIQINIPIKEEQIKSMKGKIYKIFTFTYYHFLYKKITGTKTGILQIFLMKIVDIFCIYSEFTWNTLHIFSTYHPGTFLFKLFSCNNSKLEQLSLIIYLRMS